MIDVMLADDEILEREVYKLLLAKNFPQVRVVAEAETGRQAIEMFELYKPDLVFMDVRMPGINGLEAIEIIRTKSNSTKFIIISAYDYFNYAKDALSFGVKEYLLKPVQQDEFISVTSEVINQIVTAAKISQQDLEIKEQLRCAIPFLEQQVINSAILGEYDKIQNCSALLKLDMTNGYFVIGKIKNQYLQDENELANNILIKEVQEHIKCLKTNLRPVLVSDFINGKIIFIFPSSYKPDIAMTFNDDAYKKCFTIQNEIFRIFRVKMFFAISDLYWGVGNIKEAYNHALSVINNIEYLNMDIVNYADIAGNFTSSFSYPYDSEKALIEKIRLGLTEQAVLVFNNIFDYTCQCLNDDINKIKFELFELYLVLSRMLVEESQITKLKEFVVSKEDYFNCTLARQIYDVFYQDIIMICNEFRDASKQKNKKIVMDAVEYIKNNYMQDIRLKDVSDYVYVSPNYFSRIFKEEKNESFIDYLTRVRIDIAKNLILRTNKSISEISWEVGYCEPNYFTKVFKKLTGVTPREFKEKLYSQEI